MKYLVVSDIHGDSSSARFIKEKFFELKCDKLLILGDILYHGPRNGLFPNYNPNIVIETLNSINDKIIAVKGNCDAEVDQMVLNFKIRNSYSFTSNGVNYFLTHGHHINYKNPKIFKEKTTIIHGHTHIIRIDHVDNDTYVNLGSISLPKNNSPKCYAVIENGLLTIFDMPGNKIN